MQTSTTTPRQSQQPVLLTEDIDAALSVEAVLVWAGLDGDTHRDRNGDWYGRRCPLEYHNHSPRGFTIDPDRRLWICNCCGIGGNLYTLIGHKLGLKTRGSDFLKIKAVAAEIAGVSARQLTAEERAQHIAAAHEKRERDERERMSRLQFERAWAIEHATAYWNALPTRNRDGEAELRRRGLLGALERGLVRFDPLGEWLSAGVKDSIAIPVYSADGKIVNVRRRRLPRYVHGPDGQRFSPVHSYISDYGYGTYVGAVTDVQAGRDVVVAEGFADSLTGALAWPSAIVIGAQSCSNLPELAKHIAPRVARYGGRMLVCPHRDNDGIRHAACAGEIAIGAGLRLDETLLIVSYPGDDLNDSWRAGWRP